MPADPTNAQLRRQSQNVNSRPTNHAREIEGKRARGEVSCAECRRLKIKCDKNIPCQSCQRRGCAAICPNGSLATGEGTRFVLSATEHLHKRISKMTDRIRQLEDALAAAQAEHPLLKEDPTTEDGKVDQEDLEATGSIGAFGTLSIADHGVSRWLGPTGGPERLLMASMQPQADSPPTGDTSLFSSSFPFTPLGPTAHVQSLVESHLPPVNRAVELVDTYYIALHWIFRGCSREQVVEDMIPIIYRQGPERDYDEVEEFSSPHSLSLLFILFAIASLLEGNPKQGHHYHQISKAAMTLQPVLEKPTTFAIQALHLMSTFNSMSGDDLESENSMEMTWGLKTLASHLSLTIGLHRDGAKWGLPHKTVLRRRVLFWDLFLGEIWQSLLTGRPPTLSPIYIDTAFPFPEGTDLRYEAYQYRFASDCISEVTQKTLSAETPSYEIVTELDKKVRDYPVPPEIKPGQPDDMIPVMQKCILSHLKETILLYIHRHHFALSLHTHPSNPLKSQYAPSFLACYRASSTILRAVREFCSIGAGELGYDNGNQGGRWVTEASKIWMMWTFAFSAGVVFASIVIHAPRCPLASSAMKELEEAIPLFEKVAGLSKRAGGALEILQRLHKKARASLTNTDAGSSSSSSSKSRKNQPKHKSASPSTGSGSSSMSSPPLSHSSYPGVIGDNVKPELYMGQDEGSDDELAIFAGHTRLFSKSGASIAVPLSAGAPPPSATSVASTASAFGLPGGPGEYGGIDPMDVDLGLGLGFDVNAAREMGLGLGLDMLGGFGYAPGNVNPGPSHQPRYQPQQHHPSFMGGQHQQQHQPQRQPPAMNVPLSDPARGWDQRQQQSQMQSQSYLSQAGPSSAPHQVPTHSHNSRELPHLRISRPTTNYPSSSEGYSPIATSSHPGDLHSAPPRSAPLPPLSVPMHSAGSGPHSAHPHTPQVSGHHPHHHHSGSFHQYSPAPHPHHHPQYSPTPPTSAQYSPSASAPGAGGFDERYLRYISGEGG